MARRLRSDTLLFTATMLLLVVSMAWVYSASAIRGDDLLVKQVLWTLLGVSCLLVTMRFDYRYYRHQAVLLLMIGATLLGLVIVFFCPARNGSHRWIGLSGTGVQPSEFAKLVTVIFMAAVLHEWFEHRDELRTVTVRIGSVVGLFVALIVVEPDFGSAAALAAVAKTG
jgi:cell division protein FtsW